MKNNRQPIRDSVPWNSQCTKDPRWLNNVFLFSTESWVEQLKKHPVDGNHMLYEKREKQITNQLSCMYKLFLQGNCKVYCNLQESHDGLFWGLSEGLTHTKELTWDTLDSEYVACGGRQKTTSKKQKIIHKQQTKNSTKIYQKITKKLNKINKKAQKRSFWSLRFRFCIWLRGMFHGNCFPQCCLSVGNRWEFKFVMVLCITWIFQTLFLQKPHLRTSYSVLMIGKGKWIISEVFKRRKNGKSSPFPSSRH